MAGRLPVKSTREVLKTFYRAKKHCVSFKRRGKGSHLILHNRFCKNFSVPIKDELPPGTLLSVITDAGMTKEEFLEYDP